jgi:ABC-type nitrate/sulfonate/bicarbonate transport system substrate-binding protein
MVQSFAAGEIDALVVTGPFRWDSLEAGRRLGAHLLHTASTSHVLKSEKARQLCHIHSVVLVHDRYLSTQAESVRALLSSLIRATEFIHRDPAEAVALLSGSSGLIPDVIGELIRLTIYEVGCGEPLITSLRNNAAVLREVGALPVDVDVPRFVYCRPYEGASLTG